MSRSTDAEAGSEAETRALVFERRLAHPPEKIWRALTERWLLEEWLMANDFEAVVGHRFTFRTKPMPGFSGVVNCEVLEVEPPRRLAYRWGDGTESDSGLVTTVSWTIAPAPGGALLRMEQAGFGDAHGLAHGRMGAGWPRILDRLETSLETSLGDRN